MHIRTVAIAALLSCAGLQAGWRVDLAEWGYQPPPPMRLPEAGGSVRFLDFDSANEVVAGFVSHAANQLATRSDPALILHVLTFDPEGKFVSDRPFPTTNQYDNYIFGALNGNLLLRTDTVLKLISPEGNLVAQRGLPGAGYPRTVLSILAAPDRTRFALRSFREPNLLLDAQDLSQVAECSYPAKHDLESISPRNAFTYLNNTNFYPRQTEVRLFCGSLQFGYQLSQGEPLDGTLLDDDRVALAGVGPTVEVIARGVRLWRDSFDKRHDQVWREVSVDTRGDRFAVLVETYQGGSRFLDISSRLKSQRVVVYDAKDGKRLVEVPIPKLPKFFFLDFALSPDGKLLAIKCDGELQVVAVDRP